MTKSTNEVPGTYREGRVDLDGAVDWPDGSRVSVIPALRAVGLREAEWADTPENRAVLLARLDAIEPLVVTPHDEARVTEALEASREISIRRVQEQMGLRP